MPIAAPCEASFDAMHGDDRRRHCDTCDKDVHDLSAGTEAEARRTLASAIGKRICVRFAKNDDGTIRFRGAAIAVALSVAACSGATPSEVVAPSAAATEAPAATTDAGTEDVDMGDYVPDVTDVCPDTGGESGEDGCPESPTG